MNGIGEGSANPGKTGLRFSRHRTGLRTVVLAVGAESWLRVNLPRPADGLLTEGLHR